MNSVILMMTMITTAFESFVKKLLMFCSPNHKMGVIRRDISFSLSCTYVQQRKNGKASVITLEIMQKFIEDYILVASRQYLFPASFNGHRVNFAASMSDGKSSSTKDNMTAKDLKTVMARLQEIAIVKNEKIFENIQFITTSFCNKGSLESFFRDGLTPKGFKSSLTSPEAFYDVGFDLVYTGKE